MQISFMNTKGFKSLSGDILSLHWDSETELFNFKGPATFNDDEINKILACAENVNGFIVLKGNY